MNYYKERLDGSGYELAETITSIGETNTVVTIPAKEYDYYSETKGEAVVSGIVKPDNSLVLSRWYKRNSYTISFQSNGGTPVQAITSEYGAFIAEPPKPSRDGFTFVGWYMDEGLTKSFDFTTMPGTNLTLYAKWKNRENRGIEYIINHITLLDEAYGTITSIPNGHFYAEASVTNLSSYCKDALVLATYDKDGKMLGIAFLYSNPQIGQTIELGTSFDNSDGEIAKIKAFMVDILGGMMPLADAIEIS